MSDPSLYKLPTLVRRESRKLTGRLFLALVAVAFLSNIVYTELLAIRWHQHPLFGHPFVHLSSYPSFPALFLAALLSVSSIPWLFSRPLRRLPVLALLPPLWMAGLAPLFPPLAHLRWPKALSHHPLLAPDLSRALH